MQVFINTFGTSLRVKNGVLSIKKDDDIKRVPIGKVEKLFITRSIFLSTDVLYECLEQGIDVIITERDGSPVGRMWNNRFGSISTVRRKQLQFSRSPHVAAWVRQQIARKSELQEELLYCLLSLRKSIPAEIHATVEQIARIRQKLLALHEQDMQSLGPKIRTLEAQMAKRYFRCINLHLPEPYRFDKRSKHPARDMTNAMLNYCYGILYSHTESALIKAGLDPFIGFFHRDEYNRPVLTYDVVEVFRPWADWVVVHLCLNEVIDENMFLVEDGAWWLHGESKRILIRHFTDFFDEVIEYDGGRFSRYHHIQLAANALATTISGTMQDPSENENQSQP